MGARLSIIAILLLSSVTPALGADGSSALPVELWNGFTTASTKAEISAFKAARPKRKVEIFSGCVSEMGYRIIKGRLVSLLFLGQDREADCFARMFNDLRSRLGEPETDTTTFGGGFAFGTASGVTMVNTASVGVVYIWRDGEKKTKIVKSPGKGYNLIFTVREDKYIY